MELKGTHGTMNVEYQLYKNTETKFTEPCLNSIIHNRI